MPLPCELTVRSVVPAMRALIAKELSYIYQIKQEEIASLLGITQSAVSQYMRGARGKAIEIGNIVEVQDIVKNLADELAKNSISYRQITQRYCAACRIIREKRLLCALHRRLDPTFSAKECDACIPL